MCSALVGPCWNCSCWFKWSANNVSCESRCVGVWGRVWTTLRNIRFAFCSLEVWGSQPLSSHWPLPSGKHVALALVQFQLMSNQLTQSPGQLCTLKFVEMSSSTYQASLLGCLSAGYHLRAFNINETTSFQPWTLDNLCLYLCRSAGAAGTAGAERQ